MLQLKCIDIRVGINLNYTNNESLGRLNELEMFQGLLLTMSTIRTVGIDLVSGVVVWDIDASGLKTDGGEVLNGIAHDDSTGSLWITGKYWSKMYNISFAEPERIPEPEVVVEPEQTAASQVEAFYSNAVLASMMVLLVTLWAMKLKDGGFNPPPEGESS